MAQDDKNPDDIEREIEHERAALRNDIDQLVNRFTFDEAWNRIGARINSDPAALGDTVLRLVKEKPIALGLTAIGLGWLMFGPAQAPVTRNRRRGAVRHVRPADVYGSGRGLDRVETDVAPPGGGTSGDAGHSASGRGWTMSSAHTDGAAPGPAANDGAGQTMPSPARTGAGTSTPGSTPAGTTAAAATQSGATGISGTGTGTGVDRSIAGSKTADQSQGRPV